MDSTSRLPIPGLEEISTSEPLTDFQSGIREQATSILSWLLIVSGICFALLNVIHGLWMLVLLNLGGFAVGALCLLLVSGRRLLAANLVLGIGALAVCISSALLYRNGAEIVLLGIMLCSALITEPAFVRRFLAISCAAGYLVVRGFEYLTPEQIEFPLFRYLLNHAFFLAAFYFLLSYFRKMNAGYFTQLQVLREDFEREHSLADEKAAALEAANRAKEKILGIISQDLRGPLENLKHSLDHFTQTEESTAAPADWILEIEENTLQLETSLENILIWSSGDLREVAASPQVIRPFVVASKELSRFRQFADLKEIAIRNSIPADLEAFADPEQVAVVFRNLIANAIRFTPPEGEIELRSDTPEGYVRIHVVDTGSGLPEGVLRSLEVSKPQIGDAGDGGGLGLWICKHFVRLQGGRLGAGPQKQETNSLWFTLPEVPTELPRQ